MVCFVCTAVGEILVIRTIACAAFSISTCSNAIEVVSGGDFVHRRFVCASSNLN